nr:MAG TPA: hypothetical protein [Caudoviricetes sp.]DAZ63691.1 MAG TPA: hypothetical protein [Caudoviricetes sp.]
MIYLPASFWIRVIMTITWTKPAEIQSRLRRR